MIATIDFAVFSFFFFSTRKKLKWANAKSVRKRRDQTLFNGASNGGEYFRRAARGGQWEKWDLNSGPSIATYILGSRAEPAATRSSVIHRFSVRPNRSVLYYIVHTLSQLVSRLRGEMWLRSLLPTVLLAASVRASAEPGLLRVPKVYNAVITSNQNLAPSRAYPVIQPVVHRTAIGYVPPPFYYPPLPPSFGGPGLPLQPGSIGPHAPPPARPEDVESVEATDGSPQNKTSKSENGEESRESAAESTEESSNSDGSNKKGKNDRTPLSFYPNYQSLYYDPYFYPYSAFPPHIPGNYYVDYPQHPGILGPLGPLPPPGYPIPDGRPAEAPTRPDKDSSPRNEKQRARPAEAREKIPDVPAPPLPTAMRKKTS